MIVHSPDSRVATGFPKSNYAKIIIHVHKPFLGLVSWFNFRIRWSVMIVRRGVKYIQSAGV